MIWNLWENEKKTYTFLQNKFLFFSTLFWNRSHLNISSFYFYFFIICSLLNEFIFLIYLFINKNRLCHREILVSSITSSSSNLRIAPPVIHSDLPSDTIFIQHYGLIKIGSIAPDIVNQLAFTKCGDQRTLTSWNLNSKKSTIAVTRLQTRIS